MPTRPFRAHGGADDQAEDAGRINHHQLTVLAASMGDVVRLAGGWLFDQAQAGWDVNVWVRQRPDLRPLTILGASALDGDSETVLRGIPHNGALAVSAELLRVDSCLRARVLETAKRGAAEVTVWGERWPAELGGPIEPAEHRLSVAARAFKARALAAAEESEVSEVSKVAEGATATEMLFDLRAEALRPLYRV
jgi:hypothetical protein